MTDLVSGRYGAYNPFWRGFGMPNNIAQPNVPAQSNAELTGISTLVSGLPGSGTKKCYMVAIPVQEGTVISKVNYLVTVEGKTAENLHAELYPGTIEGKETKVLTQSAAASGKVTSPVGVFGLEVEKPQTITSEIAPYGFIYAGITFTETTVAKVVTVGVPTACQVEWWKGFPKVLAMDVAEKGTGEASAGFKPETAVAVVPLVFLT